MQTTFDKLGPLPAGMINEDQAAVLDHVIMFCYQERELAGLTLTGPDGDELPISKKDAQHALDLIIDRLEGWP